MPTFTRTVSATYTRMSLLILQVRITLKRTTSASEETLKEVFETGLNEKLLGKIHVYAVDRNEFCHAQLTLEIDWDRHKFHIVEGREFIEIDERCENRTAIEIDEVIKLFNDICQSRDLRTFWHVEYAPGVDKEYARERLGLGPAKPPKWYSIEAGWATKIEGLDELKIGLYLSE